MLVVSDDEDFAYGFSSTTATAALAIGGRVLWLEPTRPPDAASEVIEGLRTGGAIRTKASGWIKALTEVVSELESRIESDNDGAPPILVVIPDCQRAQRLTGEEPYVDPFADDDAVPVNEDALVRDILRRGPEFGVHVLMHFDRAAAASQRLSRSSLDECMGWRVVTRMGERDSVMVVENAAASRMEPGHVLLFELNAADQQLARRADGPTLEWVEMTIEALEKDEV